MVQEHQKLLQQQKGGKKISKKLKELQDELQKASGRGVVALFFTENIIDVDDEMANSLDLSARVQFFVHKNNLKKKSGLDGQQQQEVTSKYVVPSERSEGGGVRT